MVPKLVTIEQARRLNLIQRLNRIGGQVDGLKRMVEEGRYCVDVLEQAGSVRAALRGFSRAMMRNYLESCATQALRSEDPAEAARIYDEVMDELYRHVR